ncbi:MAG: oligopeptide/dipeptide ABC transporter ATP-binding protein [Polyangiaceae bacterium]
MSVLHVNDLKVHFPIRRGLLQRKVGTVKAVDGVSFDVAEGQTLGLVGESGCGKSTTGRAILRLIPPTSGEVAVNGRTVTRTVDGVARSALSEGELMAARREMQMVFQDPYASLDPRQTIFDILAEPMRVHGVAKKKDDLVDRVVSVMAETGLTPAYMRRYPHEFSGGQKQRIGIARAIALRPKLVVLDEPVSALDVSIQAQIINLLIDLREKLALTYVFIAHDLAVVRHISHAVAVMYLGRIVEHAETESLFAKPRHPYTKALLSAIPIPDPRIERTRKRLTLVGEVPSPIDPPSGCTFHTRCPDAIERCSQESPALVDKGGGHKVACHLVTAEAPTSADAAS